MSRKKKTPPARPGEPPSMSGGQQPPVTDEKMATQVWQPRRVFEMNVYLLRNTGLDLQRWFEREVQALTGQSAAGHAC